MKAVCLQRSAWFLVAMVVAACTGEKGSREPTAELDPTVNDLAKSSIDCSVGQSPRYGTGGWSCSGGSAHGVALVRSFGAAGDGVTDDTTAVDAALASLSSGGRLHFSPGTYRLSNKIVLPAQVSLVISGDGRDITRLLFVGSGDDAGFEFDGGQITAWDTAKITVSGLTLMREGQGGAAFRMAWVGGQGTSDATGTFSDIWIRPASRPNDYWDVGFDLSNARVSTFTRILFHGKPGFPYQSQAFIRLAGDETHAVYYIDGCAVWSAERAIEVLDVGTTPHPRTEGVYITNSSFVAVGYGVWWEDGMTLSMLNSHISSTKGGIYANTVNVVSVMNNSIAKRNTTDSDWVGIYIESTLVDESGDNIPSRLNNISYNLIRGGTIVDSYDRQGIILDNVEKSRIVGNQFLSLTDAIWLKPTAQEMLVLDNVAHDVTNAVVDEGVGNTIRTP